MSLNVYMHSIRQQRQHAVKRDVGRLTCVLLPGLHSREGGVNGG